MWFTTKVIFRNHDKQFVNYLQVISLLQKGQHSSVLCKNKLTKKAEVELSEEFTEKEMSGEEFSRSSSKFQMNFSSICAQGRKTASWPFPFLRAVYPTLKSWCSVGLRKTASLWKNADCLDGINPSFINGIQTFLMEFQEAAGGWGKRQRRLSFWQELAVVSQETIQQREIREVLGEF